MIKKNILLLFLALSITLVSQAQRIQGTVVDEHTGQPVPYASIGSAGAGEATITNENGEFILKVAAFPARIRVSHVSYRLTEFLIPQEESSLHLKLRQADILLNEVVIEPDKAARLLTAALKKAKEEVKNFTFANGFYRQLTTINEQPSEIYELFYDLKWNNEGVKAWKAKQSRYATSLTNNRFSINNQSFLTFIFGGTLLPEKSGKSIRLTTTSAYNIVIDHYIEQADQTIAVINCIPKKVLSYEMYVNSTYYIGTKDLYIYRLDNELINLPVYFDGMVPVQPPTFTTTATFHAAGGAPPVLESIATKMNVHLGTEKLPNYISATSLLSVYRTDPGLKTQKFVSLNSNVEDKKVIRSIRYDPEFWNDNPIVKQTSLADSFIKMMESKSAFGTMIKP